MKEAEMTPELENDLKAIQMRSILDPKRFYKKNDMKTLPKFVQVSLKNVSKYKLHVQIQNKIVAGTACYMDFVTVVLFIWKRVIRAGFLRKIVL